MISEDNDVFSRAAAKADIIVLPIYVKQGTQNKTWFVNINNISDNLGSGLSRSNPRIHAFTGCDSVSAFAEEGKLAVLKLLRKHPTLKNTYTPSISEYINKFDFQRMCIHFSGKGNSARFFARSHFA